MSDAAAFAAFNGLRITLPNGKLFEGKPLDFMVALDLLELLTRFQNGEDPATTLRPMLNKFFAATGADRALAAGLTLGEINDVVRRFFFQRRWSAADMKKLGIVVEENGELPTSAPAPSSAPPPAPVGPTA